MFRFLNASFVVNDRNFFSGFNEKIWPGRILLGDDGAFRINKYSAVIDVFKYWMLGQLVNGRRRTIVQVI